MPVDHETEEVSVYHVFPSPDTTTTTRDAVLGQRKTFIGLSALEWAFLLLTITNIVACLGLTLYRLVIVVEQDPKSPDFTFTILLIINSAFCLFYVLHGLLREKEYEIYALIASIIVVLLYCVIEFSVNKSGRTKIKLSRLIIACVVAPPNIILGILVARNFGWLEFRIVGASTALQRCRGIALLVILQRCESLICTKKYPVSPPFSSLTYKYVYIVIILKDGTDVELSAILALSIGLPVSLIWIIWGWISVRREWQWGMWIFAALGMLMPGFVIYELYRAYQNLNHVLRYQPNDMVLVYSLLAAGSLSLLVRGILYFEGFKVTRNFGQGLKERAFSAEANEQTSLLSRPRRR